MTLPLVSENSFYMMPDPPIGGGGSNPPPDASPSSIDQENRPVTPEDAG